MGYVYMPRVDPGMETGTIVEWLKSVGDRIRRGEALLVVEGEKTTFEVSAPADGVLSQILCPAGTDVKVAQPVAIIGGLQGGEPVTMPLQALSAPTRTIEFPTPSFQPPQPLKPETVERVPASPAARRLARERGIDIQHVRGTGPGGRITTEDVLAAVGAQLKPAIVTPAISPIAETFRLTGVRRTIAERLSHSWRTSVPVSLSIDVDFEAILARRPEDERQSGRRLSLTVYIAKAVASTLREHPHLNATIEGDEVRVLRQVNLAVAVDTPHGLMAPVIRGVEQKPLAALAAELDGLTEKALNRQLNLDELTGSTFTVTNLGGFGVASFAPVINPPNVAILGIASVEARPRVVQGRILSKQLATLTLVFDHRVIDGGPAAAFMQALKKRLEAGQVD